MKRVLPGWRSSTAAAAGVKDREMADGTDGEGDR